MNLKDKKIIVFGGTGFLGKHFKNLLSNNLNFECCSSIDIDLLSISNNNPYRLKRLFSKDDNDGIIVINLAADCGGIGYNRDNPVTLFTNNIKMIMNAFEICCEFDVETLVNLGTVCSYPMWPKIPFKESDIWDGYPEPTNAPYGIAKKMAIVLSESYKKQYGLNSINLIAANMYGPHDHFNSVKGHVIPDLIHKFTYAKINKENSVTLWGTGKPTRDFLYAEDSIKIILKILESGCFDISPVNIGTGAEISIALLSYHIAKYLKFKGEVIWDESKPDGQPRRVLDISRLTNIIGYYKFESIEDGLKKTIDCYLNTIEGSIR